MISYENLEKVLSRVNAKKIYDETYFTRSWEIICFESKITIIWFANIGTIKINDIEIKFDDLEISGTWPNKFNMNLQFSLRGNPSCIIPYSTQHV